MSQTHLYTTKEAAERLGVHRNTIRAMVKDGRLKAYKTKDTTGHLRFSEEDLSAFVDDHDLSRVSPKLIRNTHMRYANQTHDVAKIEKLLNNEHDMALFRHLLETMDPVRVFGSYLSIAQSDEYASLVSGKAHKWVTGGLGTMDMSGKNKFKSGLLAKQLSIGLGSVDMGEFHKPLTAFLVFHGQNADIVLDGTLQQFVPSLNKGIVLMEKDVAESFYIKLNELSIAEYANEVDADVSPVFDAIIDSVLDSEMGE